MTTNNALAIIPARGGSKRIPGKNIKDFCGKPIIQYSIEAALKSNCFNEVMVSTDDQQIAKVATQSGALVPFMRSANNSNDQSHLVDVVIEVLTQYQKAGKAFQYVCCILPTAPFVSADKIMEGLALLKEKKAISVFTITKFEYPIQRALNFKDDRIRMKWSRNYNSRSQDLLSTYHDAGQFYWLDVPKVLKYQRFFTHKSYAVELDNLAVQDIDTLEDWQGAEIKYKILSEIKKIK